jgi:hypothetical protein
MAIYIGVYVSIVFFTLIYLYLPRNLRKKFKAPFYLLVIFVVIVTIFRKDIGTDYETYYEIYQNSPLPFKFLENPFGNRIEPGYGLLNVIAKFLGLGFPFVSLVCVCLVIVNYYKASKNFNLDFPVVFLTYLGLYFFSHNFNVVRHGLAASFIWHAFSLTTINESKKQSIILLLISALFHYISLIFIPFLWVVNRRISYKLMVITLISAVLIVILKLDIISQVLDLLFSWNSRYQFYKTVYYKNIGGESGYGLAIGVLVNLILIFVLIFVKARENVRTENQKVTNVLINGLYFALLSLLLLSKNGVFAERIGGVFYVSLIFILPLIFYLYFDRKSIRFLFSIIFVLYIGLYYFKTISIKDINGDFQYLPYRSIIN